VIGSVDDEPPRGMGARSFACVGRVDEPRAPIADQDVPWSESPLNDGRQGAPARNARGWSSYWNGAGGTSLLTSVRSWPLWRAPGDGDLN